MPLYSLHALYWGLAVFDKRKASLTILDSLPNLGAFLDAGKSDGPLMKWATNVREKINLVNWPIEWALNEKNFSPRQKYAYDCGLFVYINALFFKHGKVPSFNNHTSADLRSYVWKCLVDSNLTALDHLHVDSENAANLSAI